MVDPSSSPRPSGRNVIVLAGGDQVDMATTDHLPEDAYVIAADSGLASAIALGLTVDRIVGDLDSVDPDQLAQARAAGVPIEQYPVDKDRTDLAIAMDSAVALEATRITVVGGHEGRLDHLLGNAALLASTSYREIEVVALMGQARVTVVHGHGSQAADRQSTELRGVPGALVTLLAVHGPATGVTTTGLVFALDDAALDPGSSIGVSNRMVARHAGVRVRAGTLLAIQPDALAQPATQPDALSREHVGICSHTDPEVN